ncbi:MAG: hypothetical protein ACI8W7_004968 [Gammaproteobacteria bacterium]|jgi:hypothetical protein
MPTHEDKSNNPDLLTRARVSLYSMPVFKCPIILLNCLDRKLLENLIEGFQAMRASLYRPLTSDLHLVQTSPRVGIEGIAMVHGESVVPHHEIAKLPIV